MMTMTISLHHQVTLHLHLAQTKGVHLPELNMTNRPPTYHQIGKKDETSQVEH